MSRGLRIAISNFSEPRPASGLDYDAWWAAQPRAAAPATRARLFEQRLDWGFHMLALAVLLLDRGAAASAEFWNFRVPRRARYLESGVYWIDFESEADLDAYLRHHGPPDLLINYGRIGRVALDRLAGQCFRVHVPCLRQAAATESRAQAECFLVDDEADLHARSMLYVPVVHTAAIRPGAEAAKVRDFVYLATPRPAKRHDLLLDALRGSELTGHLHPVEAGTVDLGGLQVTTSAWGERDIGELLATSRIAVYAGDRTSNPAALWECIAAGLPVVVNREIHGGRHAVVPGVTGELADPEDLLAALRALLGRRGSYRPREHFEAHWDTVATLDGYLDFFARMGWPRPSCS